MADNRKTVHVPEVLGGISIEYSPEITPTNFIETFLEELKAAAAAGMLGAYRQRSVDQNGTCSPSL